jgi:ribonucleotide monophosphatase NagD (HAD superfamily)
LALATQYLRDPECLFVATNGDPNFIAGGSGKLMPDVGATLASIECASGRKATLIGKPHPYALQFMLQDHFMNEQERWTDPEFLRQICYVGDNLETDIGFSKNSGIVSVLVLSGMTGKTPEDMAKIKEIQPDFVMEKFVLDQ